MSEKRYELVVCEWEEHVRCVYLNDFRIAGSKPWGGGKTLAKWSVSAEDLYRAIPELRPITPPNQTT